MATGVDELFNSFWEWRMENSPEFASFCGDHRYDNLLDDYSLQAFQKRQSTASDFLEKCQSIDHAKLEEDQSFSLMLLESDLKTVLKGMDFYGFLFTMNFMEGIQVDFEQLTSWMLFDSVDDYEKYVSRLQALPKRIDDVIELMRNGIETGLTQHKQAMDGVLNNIAVYKKQPRSTPLFEPFVNAPENLNLFALEEKAVSVIYIEVQPAFLRLEHFLQTEYLHNLRDSEGVHCLPNGAEFYQECLNWHLSLNMTPEEVHNLGLQEMERIKEEMFEVIRKTGYQGDFKSFVEQLRLDKRFYYQSKDELYNGFKSLCDDEIHPRLLKLFHRIPDAKLIIEKTPDSRPNNPMGYYLAGTLDGSRPGKFFINQHKFEALPTYEMATLSLHEGEPGHHFQGMYAIESVGVPSFRQYLEDMNYYSAPSRFPLHTAYVEGWGLYCEYLGKELGMYDDPYCMFGHLSYEMHRACRLVADTGIHAFGWSYEQAVELFYENTTLAETFIHSEIRRYITWPGQACAYKIGQLKIQELRKKSEDILGEAFDVRDFHDAVLKCLPVPLMVLEKIIDQYISKKSNQST